MQVIAVGFSFLCRYLFIHTESTKNDNKTNTNQSRILMVMPWMEMGGAEQFLFLYSFLLLTHRVNLNIVQYLQKSGVQVTLVATMIDPQNVWWSEFAAIVPGRLLCFYFVLMKKDMFTLSTFLPMSDFAQFIGRLVPFF